MEALLKIKDKSFRWKIKPVKLKYDKRHQIAGSIK